MPTFLPPSWHLRTRAISDDAASDRTLSATIPTATYSASALSVSSVFLAVDQPAGTTIYGIPKTGGAFAAVTQDTAGPLKSNQEASVATSSAYVFWVGAQGVYRAPIAGGRSGSADSGPASFSSSCTRGDILSEHAASFVGFYGVVLQGVGERVRARESERAR